MAEPENEYEKKDDVVEYFGADGEDEGKKFHETGEASDIDDQTIAPPG